MRNHGSTVPSGGGRRNLISHRLVHWTLNKGQREDRNSWLTVMRESPQERRRERERERVFLLILRIYNLPGRVNNSASGAISSRETEEKARFMRPWGSPRKSGKLPPPSEGRRNFRNECENSGTWKKGESVRKTFHIRGNIQTRTLRRVKFSQLRPEFLVLQA